MADFIELDLRELIDRLDEEAFIVTPALQEKLDHYTEILHEKNKDIPESFSVALYLLGLTLENLSDDEQFEDIKGDMFDFMSAVFEFHGGTIN